MRLRNASNVGSSRAFFTLSHFEVDGIANFQSVKSDAREVLRVKEEVLSFAFARDKTKSTLSKGLDCSSHVFESMMFVKKFDYYLPFGRCYFCVYLTT